MAMAKLMVAMLTPVEPAMGKRNNPCVCRIPMVTINIAAAARVRNSQDFELSLGMMISIYKLA
jgi:hypothetical protein